MYPFLFDWVVAGNHLRIPTYGVFLALAFSAAYFESLRRAVKLQEHPRYIENLFLLIVLGSVVGARLFHVLFEDLNFYIAHPSKILAVWEGGYTLYGAILVCTAFVFAYTRKKKIDRWQFLDIAAASTVLGIFIGRLGCFFAGCCWGKPTSSIFGVTFSNPEAFTTIHDRPVHPAQLYESLGALIIFFYLQWRFAHRRFKGQIFLESLAFYSVLRFVVEFFRGDEYRGFVFGGLISYAQLISFLIFPTALVLLAHRWARHREE